MLGCGPKAGELWEPRMNAEVPAPQLGSEKSWDMGAQLTGFLRLPAVESANTLHLVEFLRLPPSCISCFGIGTLKLMAVGPCTLAILESWTLVNL